MKVSIVTPTTGNRIDALSRCIESVLVQDYTDDIYHLIVGDHLNSEDVGRVSEVCKQFGVTFLNDQRKINTAYPPVRTGRVRNFGIDHCTTDYIGHLDDDNTFEANHVSSLMALFRNPEVDIAYSWRQFRRDDGKLFPLEGYPWVIQHRPEIAREVFIELEKEGIFKDGSPIVKDRVLTSSKDLFHVDSSEWIMKRKVFDKVRFIESATPRQMIYQYTEDYLFCKAAYEKGFQFKCSEKVTLNYYIGGYHSKR